MRILVIHNAYGRFSGEEAVVEAQAALLAAAGHTVRRYGRSSEELAGSMPGAVKGFFAGFGNPFERKRVRKCLAEFRPDIVHIHNLYPLISPAILPVCRQTGVPVVMTVHNYRLVCPNGLHMVRGEICERCRGGREWCCVWRNCEGNPGKSLGYALRNAVARKLRWYKDNVTLYACLTEFQRQRLQDAGFPAERLRVIPNMAAVPEPAGNTGAEPGARNGGDAGPPSLPGGGYVAYCGRLGREKGIPVLLAAAALLPEFNFQIAGRGEMTPLVQAACSPRLQYRGQLDGPAVADFYRRCAVVVLPTICFEGFPVTLVEAMQHRKPAVASRIGGIPEIVEDGITGLLVPPGDARALAEALRELYANPGRARSMGRAGREKAEREYSPDRYRQRLLALYEEAVRLGPGCWLKRNNLRKL